MSSIPMRCILLASANVALASLASVAAAAPPVATAPGSKPIILAQASPSVTTTAPQAVVVMQYPAYQRGVREAAAQGPEALRRYVWRTRMIYNFNFNDFAQMPM